MKIYTRTGDNGTTSLSGGKRIPKHHVRVEAFGTVDELISWIGLLRDQKENNEHRDFLLFLQNQLMKCAAVLASDDSQNLTPKLLPDTDCVKMVENEIDKIDKNLSPLKNLIIPGGNIVVSYCHIARCVCRRAERAVLRLNVTDEIPPVISMFLNRIADYLFILSRKISLDLDIEEIKWLI
ncbi:MAG TPA: cob(I)yrinic acid a,c-diamide adenosyltransferase [Bacteroidales bacterium]|nr:cob(I)yrinic acid a,c-diamide adenosyltransferase [Bacteroidales bacterium]